MAEIKVRNLSDEVVLKLDELARKKNMSRESYLRQQLELLCYAPLLRELEQNYTTLVKQVCDFLEHQNKRIEVFLQKNSDI